jgi:DNA-binding transcriptional regulator YhcF (GntR family)
MSSPTPIYVQLRNEIVMGIGLGKLKIGEGLPTVRQMAQDIGVNTMTVTKAYNILKIEGYIEIDRRHGAKVSPTLDTTKVFKEKLENELLLIIAESSIKGMEKNDFLELCSNIFDNMNSLKFIGGEA